MTTRDLDLNLNLRYAHGLGALADHFQALEQGRVLAARCADCGRTWFPPHARCPDDGGDCREVELAGDGIVVSETRTRTRLPFTDADTDTDVTFVLVAMTGADNAAFGRLQGFAGDHAAGLAVHLAVPEGPLGHPAQALVFRPAEDT